MTLPFVACEELALIKAFPKAVLFPPMSGLKGIELLPHIGEAFQKK